MPTVHVVDHSSVPAQRVLAAARDFSEQRAEMWPDVHAEHLTVHDVGETFAEVTEGNPWPLLGIVWERLRYDWSRPGAVTGTVVDSNLFKPGSSWEIHARAEDDRTLVEVIAVRHLKGRGWLTAPFFPLGLAKRTVADHLRHFLSKVEEQESLA